MGIPVAAQVGPEQSLQIARPWRRDCGCPVKMLAQSRRLYLSSSPPHRCCTNLLCSFAVSSPLSILSCPDSHHTMNPTLHPIPAAERRAHR
jgi:hypothetical protein